MNILGKTDMGFWRFIKAGSSVIIIILLILSVRYWQAQRTEEKAVAAFIQAQGLSNLSQTYEVAVMTSEAIRATFNTKESTFRHLDLRKRPFLRHDTATLLACREGLCGEGTRVLVNVLNAMGFDATRVALYGTHFESGHALVAVRIDGRDIFVDSIASDEAFHRMILSRRIGPEDFGLAAYQSDLEATRVILTTLSGHKSNPFGRGYIGYSFEAIPFNRLASVFGFQLRVFNLRRPPGWLSSLAEKPNAALAVFYGGLAILIVLARLFTGLLTRGMRWRHERKLERGARLDLNNILRTEILGLPLDVMSPAQARERVRWLLSRSGAPKPILAVNPEKVLRLRKETDLLPLFHDAGLLLPDGVGAVLAGRLLHGLRVQRITGADFMLDVCAVAVEESAPIYLYGAFPSVNDTARRVLQERFPQLRIAGASHGFVPEEQMGELVASINASGAKVLFVALGSPRQERWMSQWLERLDVRVCQGIGGSLDALTGRVRRAPRIFQCLGLEWFYRLCSEPQRIRRQIVLPWFVILVLWNWLLLGMGFRTPSGRSV